MILRLYVGAIQHSTELSIELEHAKGAATIAYAQARRCASLAGSK
ncbi:MAG TPA: hypothetical protein VFV05_13615 [Methylomirabilota bacterium]|nr:hypothetical protein [Methylomirabilota bacterium]